jgi:hypothetical protein
MVGGPLQPLVEVRIDGHGPFRFLVDLGGNVLSIRKDVSDSIGLVLVQDVGARAVVKARAVQLGSATLRDVYFVREPTLDVDGVIGFNLFRAGLVTLDYPEQRFAWRPGALADADGGSIVSFELRDRMPYVQAQVGQATKWVNLDTGAKAVVVAPATAETSLLLEGPVVSGPILWNQAEGTIRTRSAKLAGNLTIGPNLLKARPTVLFSGALEDEFLIGSGALVDSRLTLDVANKRLKVELRPVPDQSRP